MKGGGGSEKNPSGFFRDEGLFEPALLIDESYAEEMRIENMKKKTVCIV